MFSLGVSGLYLMTSVVQKVELDHRNVSPGPKLSLYELWLLVSFEEQIQLPVVMEDM